LIKGIGEEIAIFFKMDDNNDLLCLMCNELFDDEGDKLPRMLPECGHSVCTLCLVNKLA